MLPHLRKYTTIRLYDYTTIQLYGNITWQAVLTILLNNDFECIVKETNETINTILSEVGNDGFWVVQTQSINGNIEKILERPFLMSVGKTNEHELHYTEEELYEINNITNVEFQYAIDICVMCNKYVD